MSAFWSCASRMLHYRFTLLWAMAFAFLSALSLGAGLVSLAPMLQMILEEEQGRSLVELARDHNASNPAVAVPEAVIDQLPTDPFRGVVLIILGLGILTVIGAMTNFLHQYLSRTVCTKAVADIRAETFEHVMHLPLMAAMQRGPSQLVARIVRDTAELFNGLVSLTSKAVAQVTKGLAAFAAALWFDFGLTLMAIIVVPLLAVILRKLGKRIRRGSRGALQAQEKLLRISSESLQGLRAVKANTAEEQAIARFHQTNEEVVRQELRVRTARAISGPIVETLAVFVIGGLALFAAQRILSGAMAFESFFLALASLAVAGASFRPLAGLINEIQAASAPAERVLELLQLESEDDRQSGLPALARHQRSLEFENVSLVYPGAEIPALREVTLRILHGERVAIVGPNGSGKTTLLSLVPRLLAPNCGVIRIDGTDITSVEVHSLRRQIGVVTQETVMFQGTVADNIAFGLPDVPHERIIDAARRAHADQFIRAIPGGYDADILEQGASLSGGQRQRIAIARAVLRDPSILILDEATSQIDAESEEHITEALREFCRGRTSLVIAHRLSTVLNADRIIVMDAGGIVDQGTHEQLLSRCELYARLNRTQLAGSIDG